MFQPNAPTPKAMPDAELNAKIAELQLQPDGLVAAMALIEQQSKLRQEDALEMSKWQLASQMHAATSPTKEAPELQDPAFQAPPSEPIVDIFASSPEPESPQVAQPPISPVAPANPVPTAAENVDEIVAALNASYAEVATEPEPVAVVPETANPEPESEPDSIPDLATSPEIELTPPIAEIIDSSEQVPSHGESSLGESENFLESPTESLIESEPEQPEQQKRFVKTGTALAFSWSWLAVSGTPLALVLAAILKEAGASLAQSFIILSASLVFTSILAAVGSMAAAKASSSLTVVSRAAFGVWGNSVPGLLMFLVKLFWSAALVYFASRVVSPLISNQPWFASVAEVIGLPAEFTAASLALAPLVLFGAIAAGLGGLLILRLQQITTVLSFVTIGFFIYFVADSYSLLDLERGEAISQTSLIDLALLLVSIFGFQAVSMSGDFARKLPMVTPGAKVFFLTFISTFFLPFIAGILGLLWLFMAGDTLGSSFSAEVLATVAGSAPVWVFVIFVVALGISIVHLISASLYSLSGSLIGLVKIPAWASQLLLTTTVAAAVIAPSYLVAVSVLQETVVELLILSAVIAASWLGIVIADALARTRGYHEVSLTREYGFYGRINITNIIGFVLSVALGFGYLNGGPQLSAWTGYLGDLTPKIFELAGSHIGIAMAFGFAALFPVIFGIPRIRKQEQNLSELDQRREELKEFLEATS
jgi:purine-cytosine permease-like protein